METPFINKLFWYAVVGATQNKEKYGYRVFMDLKKSHFNVWPVNPKYQEVEGEKCYPDLKSLPQPPDVVVVVVSPTVGVDILQQAAELGIKKLWFQPGAQSEEIKELARKKGIEIIADNSCIMVERRRLGL